MSSDQRTPTTARRPDASMSLLRDLADTSVDPDYARVSASGRVPRNRWVLFVTVLLAGALFGLAAMQNARSAPAVQQEHQQLISQVKAAQAEVKTLQEQVLADQKEIRDLQNQNLGDTTTQETLTELGVASGAVPVVGPGVVVLVDDAPSLDPQTSQVVDQDLRQLVNALWASGAEAIAVNGHRISSRTSIRGAGSAITVDYVSLTPPYRIEAIGDPKTIPAALQESSGGQWWAFLRRNYGMRYEVSTADELRLKADPGLGVRLARVPR